MADIAMCNGKGCERKENCYRHKATPNPHWQSIIAPKDRIDCEYYWPIKEDK